MSDQTSETAPAVAEPAPQPVVDPVAAARAVMAGQTPQPDEITGLKRQVKALWIMGIVTLVLVIILGVFSFLPRMFGFGRPDFGNGNFRPGMMQGQGQGQGLQNGGPGGNDDGGTNQQ